MVLNNGKSFVMMSGSTQPKGQRDEWFSPKWIFDALELQFDIDVCAPVNGVSWIPAIKHFSMQDDGLQQDWMGKRVWMNPPYSKPLPWTNKFRENANGIALIPTTIGKWWLELYEDKRTSWLALPPMRFIDPKGNTARNTMPSRAWLVAVGDTCIEALRKSGLGHVR